VRPSSSIFFRRTTAFTCFEQPQFLSPDIDRRNSILPEKSAIRIGAHMGVGTRCLRSLVELDQHLWIIGAVSACALLVIRSNSSRNAPSASIVSVMVRLGIGSFSGAKRVIAADRPKIKQNIPENIPILLYTLFFQRFSVAFLAISARRSSDIAFARAAPPLRPMACAALSLPSSGTVSSARGRAWRHDDLGFGRRAPRNPKAPARRRRDEALLEPPHVPMSCAARRLWAASAISLRSRQSWRSASAFAGSAARRARSISSRTGPSQSMRRCIWPNRIL
jgi:hypothetical protein